MPESTKELANGKYIDDQMGNGVPEGGTTGQVLAKASNDDYDTEWVTGGGGASPLTTKGDLYTRNSTVDTRLPVGLDTQVLIADSTTATGLKWGSNTAPTPTGYYGSFFDITTQVATLANTAYPMFFGQTDLSNGVTIVSNGTNLTRITIANTGIYNIQFSAQLSSIDVAPHDATIWLRKNGVDVPDSAGYVGMEARKSALDPYHVVAAWNYVVSAVGGDYFEIMWAVDDTDISIISYAATAFAPEVPSTILTVTQQSGIMAGTGITAINSLTGAVQTLGTGTSGTNFGIVSSGTSHTFNLPNASATARGALTSTDWSTFNSKQSALSFSTGLTNTSGTVTNNLSVGVSGGQTAIGGTASGNSLTLSSTTNATKGKILFGTSGYDEANNRLGIGTSSPANTFDVIRGAAGTMARNTFESASFTFNGDAKVGVYTSSATATDGAAIAFAQTNLQANSRYPGFELQYIYSNTVANNAMRINYTERSAAGVVQNYTANVLQAFANGTVVINPTVLGVAATAKLLVGTASSTHMFDVNGTGRFQSTLVTTGIVRAFIARTSAYTLGTVDDIVSADATSAAFQVTLPTAVGATGRTYTIKRVNAGANAVTVGTTSSQTIDGATTYSLGAQWEYVTVTSNGANWLIISSSK